MTPEFVDTKSAATLGKGARTPASSIRDPGLSRLCASYKKVVTSRYRTLSYHELEYLPSTPLFVSPKIDGELWFLVVDQHSESIAFVSPRGKAIYGEVPALEEVRTQVLPRVVGRLVVAGELFSVRERGRPRARDVGRTLGGGDKAAVERFGFHAFDILTGGDAEQPGTMPLYSDRLKTLRRLFANGKRVQAITTEETTTRIAVEGLYQNWAATGNAEGLVARADDGRIYKIKPEFTLDAAIVGYTDSSEEPGVVRSILLALMREDGSFQILGACGNFESDAFQRELYELLEKEQTPSAYRHAAASGALFRFVKPQHVAEIKVHDVTVEDGLGRPVERMTLSFDQDKGWSTLRFFPGASIIHPIFERLRDDKTVSLVDIRAEQLTERIALPRLQETAEALERPKSELLTRTVFKKEHRGATMVRKIVVWKTNKAEVDDAFPHFVVHFTDYSPNRKDPLKRKIRFAATLNAAKDMAADIMDKEIKSGWQEV